jgi:hypothetical protein
MGCSVYSLQGTNRYLSIDLGRLNVGVAEELLNEADIGAVLVHEGRHRVTENVACARFVEFGHRDVMTSDVCQVIAADWLAFAC